MSNQIESENRNPTADSQLRVFITPNPKDSLRGAPPFYKAWVMVTGEKRGYILRDNCFLMYAVSDAEVVDPNYTIIQDPVSSIDELIKLLDTQPV